MAEHFPLLVPGAKAPGGRLEVRAPFDGTLIATVDTGDRAVAEKAFETAHDLYRDRDAWLTPAERI